MNQKMLLLTAVVTAAAIIPSAYAQNDASSGAAPASSMSMSSSASTPATSRKAMKAADRKLAKAVRKAIEHVKGLDATHIAIVAKDGSVTLTGSVPAAPQIDLAVQQAKTVSGVTNVTSRLEVGQLGP
jgi:hyperosmotically inducible periplasmic protein